jgi:hypothetical protein
MRGPTPVYEPRVIKRRQPKKTFSRNVLSGRSTKAQVEARKDALHSILAAMRPMTVRQVFYQATVRGVIEKTEAGYNKVKTDLIQMRRAKRVPYDWITDSTRWQRKPQTFNSAEDALRETARLYRKALWNDIDAYVEIWLEKDALSGVVYPVTWQFDVPLMVARGYASLSFLHSAAEHINSLDVPVYIYHLGDYDPSGVNAGEKIEETLRELAPGAEIHFERLAVTEQQIADWDLPTRPTKQSDSRAKNHGDISVELDAIEPGRLRQLVSEAIELHLPKEQFEILKAAEQSERRGLMALARKASGDDGDDDEPSPSPPFYKEAVQFIETFEGSAGQLLDWWRSKAKDRAKLALEDQTRLSKICSEKFSKLPSHEGGTP